TVSVQIETDQLQLKSEVDAINAEIGYATTWRFLPDSVFAETPYGIVRNSVLNIRGNPKYSAEQVTQAVFGTPVKILKKKGGWVYIQTPEKYLGWAESQIIQRLTKAEYQNWLKSEKLIVIEETPIYSEANSNSLIAKHVVKGAILEQKGNKSAK